MSAPSLSLSKNSCTHEADAQSHHGTGAAHAVSHTYPYVGDVCEPHHAEREGHPCRKVRRSEIKSLRKHTATSDTPLLKPCGS
jgi:hypothetical protein